MTQMPPKGYVLCPLCWKPHFTIKEWNTAGQFPRWKQYQLYCPNVVTQSEKTEASK